jgi:hypothetical protein
MLWLGVSVLLLFVRPFFVLSFVLICVMFCAPAFDDDVTSFVWTFDSNVVQELYNFKKFQTKIKLETE